VTGNRVSVVDHHDRQDARHAVPLRPRSRGAVDFVVRDRDRFPDAIDEGPGFPLESRPQHRQRDVSGLTTGGLSADAVDDHEQAARDVDMNAIFVHFPVHAGIGLAGGAQRAGCPYHFVHFTSRVRNAIQT
jgi:hypothetical protein